MGILWRGKKLFCGKPWTFTEYSCDEDTIYVRQGVLSIKEEQVSFYRVLDVSMQQSFTDRLFNQGTIILNTTDVNNRKFVLEKIGNPSRVRSLINSQVEKARRKTHIRTNEYYNPNMYEEDFDNSDFSEDEYY